MVSAGGWIDGRIPPARLDGVRDEPRPLGVQLWDREPAMIREAAFRLRDYGVSLIDLNFGCPKRRIMGKQGAGATLLRDPATVGALVAAAVDGAGEIPVTAKIRLGPSSDEHTAVEVAQPGRGQRCRGGHRARARRRPVVLTAMSAVGHRACRGGAIDSCHRQRRHRRRGVGVARAEDDRRRRRDGGAHRAQSPVGVPGDHGCTARGGCAARRPLCASSCRRCCTITRPWWNCTAMRWERS